MVYGTDWCPQTVRAKRFLSGRGATFRWCNIEKDPVGCAYVEKVNGGKRSVPTILFPDGSILVEPTDADLDKQLSRLP